MKGPSGGNDADFVGGIDGGDEQGGRRPGVSHALVMNADAGMRRSERRAVWPPHPTLRATFSPLGRRGSKPLPLFSTADVEAGRFHNSLLPRGEKVPAGG